MKGIFTNKKTALVSLIALVFLCALGFALSLNIGAVKAEAPVYEVTEITGVVSAAGTSNDAFYVNAASASDSITGTWYIQYGGAAKKNGEDITITFRVIKEDNRTLYFEGAAANEGDVISVGGVYPITNVIDGCPVKVAIGDYSVKLEAAEFVYKGNNVWEKAKDKSDEAPSENIFLDANGTDLWLSGQLVGMQDNTDNGNWWGFLPGSEGNLKVFYTSNALPDGKTIQVNLAKRYKASNFATVNVKMLIGNAAGVVHTAYATADAAFATPAGAVSTTNETEAVIFDVDASKIADSEGYIDSFVIKRTGSDGQVFVDYVELVPDRKDDTAYELPLTLPVDGKTVVMSPASYARDQWGVLDDNKEAIVASTENVGNNTVMKFSFMTKYKASNFLMVSAYIGATNWTDGNKITISMYALSDTGLTNPVAKAEHSSVSFGRANVNAKTEDLADSEGYIGGFYLVKTQTGTAAEPDPKWQFFAGSVSLVPNDPLSETKYVATGYFGEGIAEENEHWTTRLENVNGWKSDEGKYEPKITVNPDEDAVNGYVFKVGFHSWFHTIATNAIIFNRPVSPSEAQAGLIIRIKAHLSPNGATYSTALGGIRLYSLDSNGAAGQGYMIPSAITQDEFVLLYLNGEEAAMLANADGYIYGMQIGAAVQRGDETDDFYIGDGVAYIAIDYIELRKGVNVTYYNATVDGETQTTIVGTGFGSETLYVSPKESETRKFFGWVAGKNASALSLDNFYDFSQALDNDVDLYGWWVDVATGTDYYGIYKTADGKIVKIYSEGVELEGYADYEKIILSADGKLYIKRASDSEILDITDTSSFRKLEAVEITFVAFGKEVAKKAMTEDDVIDYTFAPDGYAFKSWVDENGKETTIATAGITALYAVCERKEIAEKDYAEYFGRYLNRTTGDILDLKENNAAVITFADGSTKNITYYLLENGGFAYIDGETETPCTFDANRVLVSTETEYAKLTSYTVTFYADGAEYATVTVNGGDYKVAAPETAPSKNGFEFIGWYTKVDGGEKYDFDGIVYRNMSLYAQFKIVDKPEEKPDDKPSENPDDKPSDDTGDKTEEKSGCGSAVSGAAGLFALAVLPMAFAVHKKKYR